MKNIKGFSMCIHFKDNDSFEKKYFSLKVLALEWFEKFKQVNKRPVTITFYCGCTPYWVYYGKSDN